MNKGFATRLTNSLLIGRDHVIKNTPELDHTGYSMHWNLTSPEVSEEDYENKGGIIYDEISVPFQLFGLTPLSIGFNVRSREPRNRYEILGDSLQKEDQINALALLLGAYSFASEKFSFPLKINDFFEINCSTDTQINGRKSHIELLNNENLISAQKYLEKFYEWVEPYIGKLGENEEIINLEKFIKGEKKLEMDEREYFEKLKERKGYENGVYYPIELEDGRSQILKDSGKKNIPLEGKLLGKIIKFNVKDLSWNFLEVQEGSLVKKIEGIDEIYQFVLKHN
ncbi:MAG: hypothetical protein NUV46_04205 [Nanoarchaeota archaeon]|nr:hypothetical protein [Nanoarchaeota archaeon]